MSTLATMLHRAGIIGEDDAGHAATRARTRGESVVASLVALGLADEGQLVGFVQSKLMIPHVSSAILAVLEQPADRSIDPAMAWRHEVLPVSIDDVGNLTLAMSDPTDVAAVDAVVAATRAYVIRAVAPRTALLRSLHRFYGPSPHAAHPPAPPAQTGTAPVRTGFTTPPAVRSGGTVPPSTAVQSVPLSNAAFGHVLPRLVQATNRDEITAVLLDFLGEGFGRVLLFVHSQNTLRGHDCRGEDLILDAVRQVRIPMSGPSTFAQVVEGGRAHFGPWPGGSPDGSRIDTMFAQAMGGIQGNVLVLPIRLADRVPLVVFAANTPYPVDPNSIAELVDAVSGALERLIRARRSQDNLPAVE